MSRSVDGLILSSGLNNKFVKSVNLNFGPQHPAAHGVLRLMLSVEKEVIIKCDPHIGLLHRGTEKLIENKIFLHGLPYFDRLDYVSTIVQENVYSLCIEQNFNFFRNSIFFHNRTIFDELTRILNHMLAVSCHALDVGSMSTIFWAFEEREKIMEFYERFSGARMHTALYKPLIFKKNISQDLLKDISFFSKNFFIVINEISNVLTNNKVWKKRLFGVGLINYNSANYNNITGVMLRSTGVKKDLRLCLFNKYNSYEFLNFASYTTYNGDSLDRFNLRILEMMESNKIVFNCINFLKKNKLLNKNNFFSFFKKKYMESIISHFKYWSSGFKIKEAIDSFYVESPKGEFGVTLFFDGSEKPFRCKIKSPSYNNLQFLKILGLGKFLSDLVTLIGTIDIVFGEIDRLLKNVFGFTNKKSFNKLKKTETKVFGRLSFNKKHVIRKIFLYNSKLCFLKKFSLYSIKVKKIFRQVISVCNVSGKHRSNLSNLSIKRHELKNILSVNNGTSFIKKFK